MTERKEDRNGFQQSDLFIRLPAADAAGVLRGAAAVAQPGAAGGQPDLLRLGRAGVHHHHGPLHPHRLLPRPAGGEVPPQRQKSPVVRGPVGDLQPLAAGLFQVRDLPGGEPVPAHRHPDPPERHLGGADGPAAGHPAAHRHLFLHLPDHELHHRRLPPRRPGAAEHGGFRRLRHHVPPADRGPHRPLQDRGGGAQPQDPRLGAVRPGGQALLRGPCQEGAAGQRRGQALGRVPGGPGGRDADRGGGLAGPRGLRLSDLLRLLRLLRHGHRPGQAVRLHLLRELRPPILRRLRDPTALPP